MPIDNQSAAIPYSDATTYPAGTLGKRIQDLLSEVIAASVPDGSVTAVKLDATDEVAFRVAIGVVIGTDVQAWDADLDAIAALTSAANKVPYATGAQTWALGDFTAFGRTLVAAASEAALKTLINAEVGVDFQAFDADLTAIAALTSAADKVPYATGAGTWALADFAAAGRALAATGESKDLVASINPETGTTYTVDVAGADSDHGRIITATNAGAIAFTLPATGPVGFYVSVYQMGAGQITFAAASGGTLVNRQAHTKTAGQYAAVELVVFANSGGSAAQWVLSGDTAAA